MARLELRATDRLQQAIWNQLPEDLQALGSKPLFVVVPDGEKLQAVIDSFSISVAGEKKKISLDGRDVVFAFLNSDEDIPSVTLPYFYGWGNVSYRIGAYEAKNGKIYIISRASNLLGNFYSYEDQDEWRLDSEAFIGGLMELTGYAAPVRNFYLKFSYDSEYDDWFPESDWPGTWMLSPAVVEIERGNWTFLRNSGFIHDHMNQVPDEYQPINQ